MLRILESLDLFAEADSDDDTTTEKTSGSPKSGVLGNVPASGQGNQAPRPPPSPSPSMDQQISLLRLRLSPLTALDSQLAERLSGGVAVSGSGKGSVFVRSGWQSRTFGLSFGKARERANSGRGRFSFTGQRSALENSADASTGDPEEGELSTELPEVEKDKLVDEAATIIHSCQDDIRELWQHPAVKRLRDNRKLRLDEWAE